MSAQNAHGTTGPHPKVTRRAVLAVGLSGAAALAGLARRRGSGSPVAMVASVAPSGGGTLAAGTGTGATALVDGTLLADDFTTLGTREIIGRKIRDSAGVRYSWTQLRPSPAWRRGPYFSTGDPGIVNGTLIRRAPTTAMYPGLSLARVPRRVEADFFFAVNGKGGRNVLVHLFADTDGTRTTAEIPLHFQIGERGYSVRAMSTIAGDTEITGFGTFPDSGSVTWVGGAVLARGVVYTVALDMVGDTVTITFPAATGTPPVTLTDTRLTSARHPGGGDGRFLVLEDEADLADEPYNGFTGVRITLGTQPV